MLKNKEAIKRPFQIIKNKYSHTYGVIFVILFSFIVGTFLGGMYEQNKYRTFLLGFKTIRENSSKYAYINPLIGNISSPATDVGMYSDIKSEIDSYLQDEKNKGNLYDYSFYFRDLNTSLWFGSNESEGFFPASLFKLPIAIAIYKEGEEDHSFLKNSVVYTEALAKKNQSVQVNAESSLVVGQAYTIEQLVERMLISSDNGAKDLLLSVVDMKYIDALFNVVSVVDPSSTTKYDISSRKYALFLRILYGSSYLDENHSELILKMLAESDFKDGIVAGIPKGIKISHKFGAYQFEEKINGETITTQQLHDCGVVYHIDNPYLICFMTKGKDLSTLYRIISHVSSLVYTHQDNIRD
jgi:hypothetical protein